MLTLQKHWQLDTNLQGTLSPLRHYEKRSINDSGETMSNEAHATVST